MTDRIKYNETTGKVEVDADVWDMIVEQMPGNCIVDEVKMKKLAKTNHAEMAKLLDISPNQPYKFRVFSGVKNKLVLSSIYPEAIIALVSVNESKHEFNISNLKLILKLELKEMLSHSTKPGLAMSLANLIAGRAKNPTPITVFELSKISGLPTQKFITTHLPTDTPATMANIKQIAITEGSTILAVVLRELQLSSSNLAKVIGINNGNISKWVRHGRVPRLNAYVALCKYFNVPFDYFSDWLE